MSKKIKISLLQCQIIANTKLMNDQITNMVREASNDDADIVILPERWRGFPDMKNFEKSVQNERGFDYSFIKDLSKEYSVSVISGGIWEKRQNKYRKEVQNYITAYYFNENGEEIGRQDKLHLYSYESDIFQPGSTLNIFKHKGSRVRFSILICFDVAFFETPRVSIENGAELLISPTFIRQEGLINWKIYLQARVLENRVPIVACNPVAFYNDRKFLGRSKIISFKPGYESPSVLEIEELGETPGILTGEVNVSYPNEIRKKRLNERIEIKKIKINIIE